MRAVEVPQAMGVVGEVGRHPVENHAIAMTVHRVDEIGEIVRSTESPRRSEIPDWLVSPAPVEGVFGDRHQLDVSEPGVFQMINQLIGQLAITEERIAVITAAFPRTQVNLVDRDRPVERLRFPRLESHSSSFQQK